MRRLPRFPAALTVLVAAPVSAAVFALDSTIDAVDASPGDGVCATAGGDCTLRAAIMEANALPGEDTIELPPGTYTLSIPGAGEDAAATGDLNILESLAIHGGGVENTIIDAAGIDRIFNIHTDLLPATGDFNIANVALTGSVTSGSGGAIFFGSSSGAPAALTISDSRVINNTAGVLGGGVAISTGGGPLTAEFRGVTISDNHARTGGGLFAHDSAREITVSKSTIARNTAELSGGGAWKQRLRPVRSCS